MPEIQGNWGSGTCGAIGREQLLLSDTVESTTPADKCCRRTPEPLYVPDFKPIPTYERSSVAAALLAVAFAIVI